MEDKTSKDDASEDKTTVKKKRAKPAKKLEQPSGKDASAAIDSYGALEVVTLRNQFYRDNYRRLMTLLMLLILINGSLVVFGWYIYETRPRPTYFATTVDGQVIKLIPLSQPGLNINQLLTWAVEAATASYTFDFVNYKAQLQKVRQYFTPTGYNNFMSALQASNNLNAVRAKKLVVSAVPTGAPVVIQEGLIGSRYAWKIQMPMRLSYQSANESIPQDIVITMLITRVSTLESEKGIGIAQFLVISR